MLLVLNARAYVRNAHSNNNSSHKTVNGMTEAVGAALVAAAMMPLRLKRLTTRMFFEKTSPERS